MLIDYPLKFDTEAIPEAESWSEESSVIENVNQTEAGTEQVSVTRYDKLSVSCFFQCSHRWTSKFKAYSKKDSVAVQMYDIELSGYKTRTMRIRNFKADPVKNSQRTPNTNGLWEISFNLEDILQSGTGGLTFEYKQNWDGGESDGKYDLNVTATEKNGKPVITDADFTKMKGGTDDAATTQNTD